MGWHRHSIGAGIVESVITLPHWDGDQDVLWMVVRRTIDGGTKRYVEYVERYMTDSMRFRGLRSDLRWFTRHRDQRTGSPRRREVAVLADGAVHGTAPCRLGHQPQAAASVVSVGLPYTATIKTMPYRGRGSGRHGAGQGAADQRHRAGPVQRLARACGTGRTRPTWTSMPCAVRFDAMDAPMYPVHRADRSAGLAGWKYEEGYADGHAAPTPLPCTVRRCCRSCTPMIVGTWRRGDTEAMELVRAAVPALHRGRARRLHRTGRGSRDRGSTTL